MPAVFAGGSWTTLTTFDALLKTVYKGPVIDELNSRDTVWGMLPKDESYDGRSLVIPVLKGRAESHGFVAAGSQIFTPITPSWSNLSILPKYFYGSLRVDKETLVQSRTDRGAFVRSFGYLVERLPVDMKDTLDRIVLGTGTGKLVDQASCTTNAFPTDNTITIDDSASALGTFPDMRKMGLFAPVEQWSAETTGATIDTGAGAQVFVSGFPSSSTITISSLSGVTPSTPNAGATRIWVRSGSRNASGSAVIRNEMMGIEGIVAATDPPFDASGLQGLLVASNAFWKAGVNSFASNRPVTTTILQSLVDIPRMRGNGKPTYFLMPYGVRTEYAELQQNVRRTVNTARISGATTGGFVENEDTKDLLEYNGIPMVVDKYIQENSIFAVDWGSLFVATYAPFDWLDDDGRVLKWIPNFASFEAIMYFYGELACIARNRNAVATQIAGEDPVLF